MRMSVDLPAQVRQLWRNHNLNSESNSLNGGGSATEPAAAQWVKTPTGSQWQALSQWQCQRRPAPAGVVSIVTQRPSYRASDGATSSASAPAPTGGPGKWTETARPWVQVQPGPSTNLKAFPIQNVKLKLAKLEVTLDCRRLRIWDDSDEKCSDRMHCE